MEIRYETRQAVPKQRLHYSSNMGSRQNKKKKQKEKETKNKMNSEK